MSLKHVLGQAAFAAALALATSASASAQVAHLILHSQPGDYIGQGQDYDITYISSDFIVLNPILPGPFPATVGFAFVQLGQTPDNAANLTFSTEELGIPLAPGTYNDAQLAPFAEAGHPGLDVGFQHLGVGYITGSFTVTDFTYTMTAPNTFAVDTFAATFEQHGNGIAPALFGTFTYNANGPAAVPEASTTVSFGLLFALGVGGAVVAARKKKMAV